MDAQILANSFVRLNISQPGRVLACVESRSLSVEQIKNRLSENGKFYILETKCLRVKLRK